MSKILSTCYSLLGCEPPCSVSLPNYRPNYPHLVILGVVVVVDGLGHISVKVDDGQPRDDRHQQQEVPGRVGHSLEAGLGLEPKLFLKSECNI